MIQQPETTMPKDQYAQQDLREAHPWPDTRGIRRWQRWLSLLDSTFSP